MTNIVAAATLHACSPTMERVIAEIDDQCDFAFRSLPRETTRAKGSYLSYHNARIVLITRCGRYGYDVSTNEPRKRFVTRVVANVKF